MKKINFASLNLVVYTLIHDILNKTNEKNNIIKFQISLTGGLFRSICGLLNFQTKCSPSPEDKCLGCFI